MISKRILPVLIALALVLSLIICGIGIYLNKLEKINFNHNKEVLQEKEAIKSELEELWNNYDAVTFTNKDLQEELNLKKKETDSLYRALTKTAPKLSLLRIYRSQIRKLREEKIKLLKTNDSLITVNVLMKDSLHLKDSQIKKYFKAKRDLYNENVALTAAIKERKKLSFYSTSGTGVKVKNSGKVIVTDKIKRLAKIKICTSVKSNSELISESKKVYFKVFGPKKALLGKIIKVKHQDKPLFYSLMHQFFYRNQRLDICKFIDVDSAELIAGEYTVEVYFDHEIHDISQFILR